MRFEERNLARSRNLGIDAAAGDVVAFIDDDAIPEARWLEDLAAAYASADVGGAGGLTLDNSGVRPQYRYSLCDRIGRTDFDRSPPFAAFNRPGADPFVYLQGTNCSFRREALERIEGFDEEIEYNYDEAEVCARVIDAGWRLEALEGAVVHHRFLPSHMRRDEGFTDPFFAIKNRAYFALRVGAGHRDRAETLASLARYLEEAKAHTADAARHGRFSEEEAATFARRADEGFARGIERGLAGVRRGRAIRPADPDAFLPYPVRVPEGRRVSVCFASADYPPRPLGGVGRYTHDLARGLAAAGHEAHVVTRDDDGPYRLDLEEGVWVHRFPVADRWIPELADHPVKGLLDHLAAVRAAVERAARRIPFDVVTGASWIGEPLLCALEGRRPVNVVCVTPMRTIAASQPATAAAPLTAPQIAIEDALLRSPALLQAISGEVAALVAETADMPVDVVWLGSADHRNRHTRSRAGDDVEILFAGRLEPRKGIDTLLEAGERLLREHPGARLRIAGADNPHANGAADAWPRWVREHAAGVAERIEFTGALTDDELMQAYADCDVFCAPSRFESFGLVHVEAMMMGRPVVGCDAGGMRETIVDGETGLLVAPGDAGALHDALARLVADAGLRARMGAAGRARYEREFALPVAVERHVERFRALTAPPARGDVPALLEQVCGLAPDAARAAAGALLDEARFPEDVEAGVRRALADPDPRALVDGLYRALLGRPAGEDGLGAHLPRVADGEDPLAIVHEIAGGVEARARDFDRGFLERLPRIGARRLRRELTELWLRDDEDAFRAGLRALLDGVEVPATGDRLRDARAALRSPEAARVAGAGDLAWLEGLRTESQIAAELRAARGDALIGAAYRLVLGREPDGGADALRGKGRGTVVRAIADSPEAAERGIPADTADRLARAVETTRRRRRSAGVPESALRAVHTDLADRLRKGSGPHIPHAAPVPAADLSRLADEVGRAREEVAGLARRLDTMHAKHEALAMDVREKLPATAAAEAPEPQVPDPAGLAARIEAIGGLRLNLGCGETPLDGYVNVDARALPGVDVVADVRRLPFEPGTVREIASHHLIEHFREHHVATVLLPYWHSLLVPGGVLRVVTPNWAVLIEHLQSGRLAFDDFKKVTFGAQDYGGDDHFALYTPGTLARLLGEGGFEGVEVLEERRQNGLSPEMELVARASARDRVA